MGPSQLYSSNSIVTALKSLGILGKIDNKFFETKKSIFVHSVISNNHSANIMTEYWEFKYRSEFERMLDDTGVSKDHVCIVGSTTLLYFDMRPPNDLDFVTLPKKRGEFDTAENVNTPGIYPINERIELKSEYLYRLGIPDTEIIFNKKYHLKVDGFKLITPELLYVYKLYREDSEDIELLEKVRNEWDKWDTRLVEKHRKRPNLPTRIIRSIRYFGFRHTLQEAKERVKNE